MNFSGSMNRPFVQYKNTSLCISAITQQTSFSDHSKEVATILNFKISFVLTFTIEILITISITTARNNTTGNLGLSWNMQLLKVFHFLYHCHHLSHEL